MTKIPEAVTKLQRAWQSAINGVTNSEHWGSDQYDPINKALEELVAEVGKRDKATEAVVEMLRQAKAQLSSLRCSYTRNQVGYQETTSVMDRATSVLEQYEETHK